MLKSWGGRGLLFFAIPYVLLPVVLDLEVLELLVEPIIKTMGGLRF